MRKTKLAFTLVELLVTIVLFTLLVATALYSFRFMSINIRKINNTNPQRAMDYTLLKKSFSSLYSYIDTDRKARIGKDRYSFYFKGTKNTCRFITKFSHFHNELVLVELTFKNHELWYEEGKVFAKGIDFHNLDRIKLTKKKKLLSNIDSFKFTYKRGNRKSRSLFKKIPDFITMEFKKNMKEQEYFFAVNSQSILKINTIIRDYNLMKSQKEMY